MVEDFSGALGWRAADPREPLSCFWSAWPFPRLLENSNCDFCWVGRKTDQNAVWRRGIRCTEPACKPRPVPSISPGSEPCECSLRSPHATIILDPQRFALEGKSTIWKAFPWLVLEFRILYETLQKYLPEQARVLAQGQGQSLFCKANRQRFVKNSEI